LRDDAGVLKLVPFHSRDSPHPLHSSQINTNVCQSFCWLDKTGVERLTDRAAPASAPAHAAAADECHLLACLCLQLHVAVLSEINVSCHTVLLLPLFCG